ncbi:hypothetical protein OS176_04440 [Xanthomonadaceae bacterium XH05]|nr:hypothetical protein [Xanthomonadaceae bacterium XH05]
MHTKLPGKGIHIVKPKIQPLSPLSTLDQQSFDPALAINDGIDRANIAQIIRRFRFKLAIGNVQTPIYQPDLQATA